MPGEADETIITRFIVEADDALAKNLELRKQIEATKQQMREFAVATKDSFEVIAASMKKVKAEELAQKVQEAVSKKGAMAAASAEMKEYSSVVTHALREVKQEASQAGTALNNLSKINFSGTRAQFLEQQQATVAFLNTMKGIYNSTQQGTQGVNTFASGIGGLGGIAKLVFGSVLGITAIGALRDLVNVFKEAIAAGLEFQQTLFTMEVAIRGLQRMGLDTTVQEWFVNIEKLKEQFPIFPRQEFTEATALAALMTREFDFTADQIAEVVRMSAVLAELTGKDLYEAVRGITYAIGSGYFESLQRAGINISRQVVAEEALRQGYEGSYNALDQNVRALITYNIVQKNLAAVQTDAGKIVETTTGQVKNLKSAWEDLKATVGLMITQTEGIRNRVKLLAFSIHSLVQSMLLLQNISNVIKKEGLLEGVIKTVPLESMDRLNKAMAELVAAGYSRDFNQMAEATQEFNSALLEVNQSLERTGNILGDVGDTEKAQFIARIRQAREAEAERVKAVQEAVDELVKVEEDIAQKRRDINIDLQRDLAKIEQDGLRRREELERDHSQRVAEIGQDLEQKIAEELAKAALERAQIGRQFALRRAEMEARYRLNELKAEREFQERMRRLREDFMFDLEDALRERDALQIIRLIRRFNLEKDRLQRDYDEERKFRAEQYRLELQELEAQRAERLRILEEELQFRIARMRAQAEQQKAEEDARFEQEKADLARETEQKKTDRMLDYQQQIADLAQLHRDRIKEIVDAFVKEHNATVQWSTAIRQVLEAEFGPGGNIDNIYKYFMSVIQAMESYLNRYHPNAFNDIFPTPPPKGKDDKDDNRQHGGILFARKPTRVVFGEGGAEAAAFQPLNELGSSNPFLNLMKTQPEMRGGVGGKLKMELLLSPDLEARIIDSTLGEFSDVILTVERENR